MGLLIDTLRAQQERVAASALKADRPLYLTAEKDRVVEAGDLAARFLFASSGDGIAAADVTWYGLTEEAGRIVLPSRE